MAQTKTKTLQDLIPQPTANPHAAAPPSSGDPSLGQSLNHLLHGVGHFLQVHNPLGGYDNTLSGGETAVSNPTPAASSTPAKTQAKGSAKKTKTKAAGPQTFNLTAADQALVAPYVQQLYAALGVGSNAKGQPTGQATANTEIPGGLAQYLTNVPANEAATLTQGLNNEATANQGMGAAIQDQINNAGQAGLLSDLLNAARYQAIYKQGLYAPAPKSGPLAQLYGDVVSGGNTLAGGSPNATTTNPFNSTQPGGTSTGAKNPYSTPPNV